MGCSQCSWLEKVDRNRQCAFLAHWLINIHSLILNGKMRAVVKTPLAISLSFLGSAMRRRLRELGEAVSANFMDNLNQYWEAWILSSLHHHQNNMYVMKNKKDKKLYVRSRCQIRAKKLNTYVKQEQSNMCRHQLRSVFIENVNVCI